jgi:hypothetical protein
MTAGTVADTQRDIPTDARPIGSVADSLDEAKAVFPAALVRQRPLSECER